jgi:hypothetical protein
MGLSVLAWPDFNSFPYTHPRLDKSRGAEVIYLLTKRKSSCKLKWFIKLNVRNGTVQYRKNGDVEWRMKNN